MHAIRSTLASMAALVLLGGLSACGGGAEDAAEEPTAPASTSESAPEEPTEEAEPSASEEAPAEEVMITIEEFAFSDPGPVAPGTEITVENLDDVVHTVTADDGEFDIDVNPGKTATFTAPSDAGDYGYFCEPHPQMTATLVVE